MYLKLNCGDKSSLNVSGCIIHILGSQDDFGDKCARLLVGEEEKDDDDDDEDDDGVVVGVRLR